MTDYQKIIALQLYALIDIAEHLQPVDVAQKRLKDRAVAAVQLAQNWVDEQRKPKLRVVK